MNNIEKPLVSEGNDQIDRLIGVAYEKVIPLMKELAKSAIAGDLRRDAVDLCCSVLQRRRKEGLLNGFFAELQQWIDKGEVNPEFINSDLGQASFQELLDFLNKEIPESERFEAMKNLFKRSVENSEFSSRAFQLMKICKKLDVNELLIISIIYKAYKQKTRTELEKIQSIFEWFSKVQEFSEGKVSAGIIEHYEENLVKNNLIGPRTYDDRSGVSYPEKFRLSSLGIELCEFIIV